MSMAERIEGAGGFSVRMKEEVFDAGTNWREARCRIR